MGTPSSSQEPFQSLKRLQQPRFMPCGHFHEPLPLFVSPGTVEASIYLGGEGKEAPPQAGEGCLSLNARPPSAKKPKSKAAVSQLLK